MAERLYGLTERTTNNLRQLLANGGEPGGGATTAPAARGVTWVKVTGAVSSGWYPGVVSIDDRGTFTDLVTAVKVRAADGSALTNGARYLCTRTGDDGNTARFTTSPVPVSAWKEPVRAATTSGGSMLTSFQPGSVIDSVLLAAGDRVLIKNQVDPTQNGIYVVNSFGLIRPPDADTGAKLLGATVVVAEGGTQADTVWVCNANAPITVGTTSLLWSTPLPPAGGGENGGAVNFGSPDVYFDSSGQGSLPGPGTYLVTVVASVFGSVVAGSTGYIDARLRDKSNGVDLTGDYRFTVLPASGAVYGQITMTARVTVSAAITFCVRGCRVSGPSSFTAGFQDPTGARQLSYTWIKVAP